MEIGSWDYAVYMYQDMETEEMPIDEREGSFHIIG